MVVAGRSLYTRRNKQHARSADFGTHSSRHKGMLVGGTTYHWLDRAEPRRRSVDGPQWGYPSASRLSGNCMPASGYRRLLAVVDAQTAHRLIHGIQDGRPVLGPQVAVDVLSGLDLAVPHLMCY